MQPQLPPDWVAIVKSLQSPPTPAWMKALDAADKIVKIAAVFVGGVWAYYKFIKGRLYRPRLESSVAGEVFRAGERNYLIVSISLHNVGTSKIEIKQKGTALRVFGCSADSNTGDSNGTGGEVDWKRITTLSIFEEHGWIESSEIIQDKLLVSLPPDQFAVRLEVRVVGQGLEWRAKAIVKLGKPKTKS